MPDYELFALAPVALQCGRQLGNEIVGAAELPTKPARDILHHHHICRPCSRCRGFGSLLGGHNAEQSVSRNGRLAEQATVLLDAAGYEQRIPRQV